MSSRRPIVSPATPRHGKARSKVLAARAEAHRLAALLDEAAAHVDDDVASKLAIAVASLRSITKVREGRTGLGDGALLKIAVGIALGALVRLERETP